MNQTLGGTIMTRIYNKHSEKDKRQTLRQQMPTAEVLLWDKLRRRRMAGVKFRRQYGVDRFVLDFYCAELKLAIEVDGSSHKSVEVQEYDQLRQESIEALRRMHKNKIPNRILLSNFLPLPRQGCFMF